MVEFPPVVPGDDIVISGTGFVTFEQCPERAAARMRGEYGPDSRAAFVGGLSHRVFARHLRQGAIPDDDLGQVCREEIGSGLNPKLTSLGMKPSEVSRVIAEVGDLYRRFKTIGFDGFREAEVALEVEPAAGVTLRGSVDAVFEDDGGVRLVDWKTGAVRDESADQLGFYALVWALERGEPPGRLEAVSVSTGQRTEEVPTGDRLRSMAARVARMVDVLRISWAENSAVDRHGGPWCGYCPVLSTCSEGRAAQQVLAPGRAPG